MKYLIKTFFKIIFKLVLYIPSRFTNKNCIIVCEYDYEDYNIVVFYMNYQKIVNIISIG